MDISASLTAVSTIADEIWQYRTGGNLTIFNEDHDTAEEGRSRIRLRASTPLLASAAKFQIRYAHPISLYCH